MKKLICLLIITLTPSIYVKPQTPIDNHYFSSGDQSYTWDIAGSPYLIDEDIEIPDGSDLQIEPGVEVLFQGYFKMDVLGSINAIGTVDSRIIITSDVGNPWNGIRFDFSDNPHPAASKLYNCDISNAQKTGTVTHSPDPESSGGAIYVKNFSGLEIRGCSIFNNSVLRHGGAIGIFSNSNIVIDNCLIHENYAEVFGGGICIADGCNPSVTANYFNQNVSGKGGGAISITSMAALACNPTIWGNTIEHNSSIGISSQYGYGGGIFICKSNASITYNTFEYNSAYTVGGGVYITGTSNLITGTSNVVLSKNFHNNIIYEAAVDLLMIETFSSPTIYSTLTTFNHFHQSNPGFVSSTDYHLSSTSPCVDAGDNLAPMTSTDLDGNQRVWNGNTDYGCYEYGSQP